MGTQYSTFLATFGDYSAM